ncbi:MAG: SDR family oxidoreductase [Bacteroidetes bacterium]|nr:SDR family oxidoreductase [Bacteroidota bacterium]
MDIDLTGMRAVVCGSTQGIGRASAIELANLGANITLVARNQKMLEQVKKELESGSDQDHHLLVVDFSQPNELKKELVEYLADISRVDILVNNTGGPPVGRVIDAALEEFEDAFSQHLICNQIITQQVTPLMIKNGYGRIINIISTSVKMPIPGLGVSNTIRGAVANWSKTLSMELGQHGITVNNILPGATMTGRLKSILEQRAIKTSKTYEEVKNQMIAEIPAGRISEPQEVANAVAFLASPAASYINGINVPVDGGRTGSL